MKIDKREATLGQCFRCIDDMTKIAKQYFKGTGFNFFGHFSVYPNGKYWFLCTGSHCPKVVFSEENLSPSDFKIYEGATEKVFFPNVDKGGNSGWTGKVAGAIKKQLNIVNPMVLMQKFEDHNEAFVFDFHCDNIYEKYINHFEIFENFIHHHKEKAKNLIKGVRKYCFMADHKYRSLNKKHTESFSDNWNNLEFVPPSKYYLRHKGKETSISLNEYKCLTLVAHGLQFRSAAKKMGVSPRTIETYFERIKKKLMLSSRDEIVAVYWANKIISV